MTPSTSLNYYSAAGAASTPITVTATTAPGCRWINFLGKLFGLGYGATSKLNDAGGTYTINASSVLQASLLGGASTQSQSISFNVGSTYTTPTQTQDSSGTVSWTENTTNWITSQSTGTWASNAVTNLLTFSNFGFSIPTSSTVVGIEVDLYGGGNSTMPTVSPVDTKAIVAGGSGTSTNMAQYQNQHTYFVGGTPHYTENVYGGPTSLWNMTWSPSQINSSSFGFTWQVGNYSGSSQSTPSFFATAQSITVTVYYAPSGSNTAPTAISGWPTGAVDITQYQSRIWLACGCDVPAGLTYHEPTSVFWTNPVTSTNSLLYTAADFQYTDPLSGITSTNKVVIDNNGSDPVMGFGRVSGAMVIFRRSSVYILKGTTTANYQIVKVSGDVGCLDPRSIVESDEGVYFMSLQGLMITNGSKVTSVSSGVSLALQAALNYQQAVILSGNANHQGGWISCGINSQGHIVVSIGVQGGAAGPAAPFPSDVYNDSSTASPTWMRTIWSGVYDPDTGSWYRLTSFLFGIDSGLWSPVTFVGVPDVPQILVSNRLVSQRSLHVVGNAGITMLEDQALASSYLTGSALYDTISSGLPGTISPEIGAIQGIGIPARWHTKMAPIVGTTTLDRRWGMPKRFFLDHAVSVTNGSQSLSYDGSVDMPTYTATLTSLSGAGTAWSVNTPNIPYAGASTQGGTVTLASSASSNELKIIPTSLGTVPSNATITGVQVVVVKGPDSYTGTLSCVDKIRLYNAGSPIGTQYTSPSWATVPETYAYGNPYTTLGATLTPAIVNSGTFGIGFIVQNTGSASITVDAYLANIIVYYTVPSGTVATVTAPSWSVTPYDSDGNAYPVTLACSYASSSSPTDPRGGPTIIAPVSGNTILRENQDFTNEMSNLTYDITLPCILNYTSSLTGKSVVGPYVAPVAFSNVIGEVYGIGTEYQTAHDLRSKVS